MERGMITQLKSLLERMLSITEGEVLDLFAKLPGAQLPEDKAWVYVPGKRPDRVLLVAHADTVHEDKVVTDVQWIGDVAMRSGGTLVKRSTGAYWLSESALGADDRAGCAMLYNLFDGNHSVLITTEEEHGCIGARAAIEDIGDELAKHQFAVQVDRRGDRHAVFYDVSTQAFEKYMLAQLTGLDHDKVAWSKQEGSSTDIKVICPETRLCGVNLSAGFWNEHSEHEMLLLGAWLHTRTVLRRILKEPKLQGFKLPKPVYVHETANDLYTQLVDICWSAIDVKARQHAFKKVNKAFGKGKITQDQHGRLLGLMGNAQYQKGTALVSQQGPKPCPECLCLGGIHLQNCSKRNQRRFCDICSVWDGAPHKDWCRHSHEQARGGDARYCPDCRAPWGSGHYQVNGKRCPRAPTVPAIQDRDREAAGEFYVCQHRCWTCQKSWKHHKAQSGCLMAFDNDCPKCSTATAQVVDHYEKQYLQRKQEGAKLQLVKGEKVCDVGCKCAECKRDAFCRRCGNRRSQHYRFTTTVPEEGIITVLRCPNSPHTYKKGGDSEAGSTTLI